jgi:hypothetical protein
MTSPTEQRRAFDAAMDSYRSGDRAGAGAVFTHITHENAAMSDAWLGRMACGDNDLDTLAGAHDHSRALYRETRRLGLNAGDLYAAFDEKAPAGNPQRRMIRATACGFGAHGPRPGPVAPPGSAIR